MASITNLEIETGRLGNDIDALTRKIGELQRTGADMMTSVNTLNSMWEGDAKEAFMTQFRSDYTTLNNMVKVLQELVQCLTEAKNQYDACEQKIGSIIQAIRV